jgi:hypothetical protein
MNWKDRALQAANVKAAQDEEAKRQQDAAERERQIAAFGAALSDLLGEEVSVEDLEVEVDGSRFKWTYDPRFNRYGVSVLGPCDVCGAVDWSEHVQSLAQLGAFLERVQPGPLHQHQHKFSWRNDNPITREEKA